MLNDAVLSLNVKNFRAESARKRKIMIEKLNYEIFEDVEIVNDGKKSFVLFLKAGKLAIRVSDKKFVFSEKAEHYLKTHSGINFYDKKWDIGLTYKTKNLSPETIKFVVLLNNK